MPSIIESLENAVRLLAAAGIPEAKREAASLLCFALRKDRAFLIAHPGHCLDENEAAAFSAVIARRAGREPFHHITGVKEFYGLDFIVSANVLIPRPETEMLVAKSIDLLGQMGSPRFCEIGIGSGCIAVSILHHVRAASATGIDISTAAIEIARRNARQHYVRDRLTLLRSDLFDDIGDERFDLIVSNPPYIPLADLPGLQPEVRDFEPFGALTDGSNGLSVIKKLVSRAPNALRSGGSLLVEIGIGQSQEVRDMFAADLWKSVDIMPDFRAIPRMVYAVVGDRNI